MEQVLGEGGPKASAIFEFPNSQTIKDMIAGEEFNSLNQLCNEAYKKVDLMICQAL